MDIDFLLKIAGIGIVVTIFYQVLKGAGRDDQAGFVSIAGIIVVLFLLVNQIIKLFETVQTLFGI